MAARRVVAGDEVIEVIAHEGASLQREVLVGAEVVDPQLLRPRPLGRRLAVEEQDVRLHAARVEDPGGQPQEGVYVALRQQLAANCLARSALEQYIVVDDEWPPA